jgi:hypothetical protein
LLCLCAPALSSQHSPAECAEGAEFIGNAARSRDNGMTREAFLQRLEADFVLIRAVPLHLRWFVRDAEDEAMLHKAATDVFESAQPPDVHGHDFLAWCTAGASGRMASR